MRTHLFAVVVVSALAFSSSNANAQGNAPGNPNAPTPVGGNGTPGTVPVWTGSGKTLIDSNIQSGVAVTVTAPLQVTGITTMDGGGGNIAVAGSNGVGLSGSGSSYGLTGTGNTGVSGTGLIGVFGRGSDAGLWGEGTGVGSGAEGHSFNGIGVFGSTQSQHNFGVLGKVFSLNPQGSTAVLGDCPATEGFCNGVIGLTGTTGSGVIGELGASAEGGSGVHGFARPTSGHVHGVVGETFSPEGAGVIGLNNSTGGQGVRGGSGSADGIGVLGYNTGGGIAGQFQGHVLITQSLTVNGQAFKPGGGSWSTTSDLRLKMAVEPIENPLRRLLQLRGVNFEYANPAAINELPGTHIGMVAQDVEQVFPSWVDTGTDGYKRLTFRGFEAVAVEAVRELDTKSAHAMARLEDLERQNAELRRLIDSLSEKVKALQEK